MAFELPRRRFLAGIGALIAAPAIVRVASIMPVKAMPMEFPGLTTMRSWEGLANTRIIRFHFDAMMRCYIEQIGLDPEKVCHAAR